MIVKMKIVNFSAIFVLSSALIYLDMIKDSSEKYVLYFFPTDCFVLENKREASACSATIPLKKETIFLISKCEAYLYGKCLMLI